MMLAGLSAGVAMMLNPAPIFSRPLPVPPRPSRFRRYRGNGGKRWIAGLYKGSARAKRATRRGGNHAKFA